MKEIETADMAAPDKDTGHRALFPRFNTVHGIASQPPMPAQAPAPEIGTKKAFVPSCMLMESGSQLNVIGVRDYSVWGEVVQVSERGRWYRVRYTMPNGSEAFECFKY